MCYIVVVVVMFIVVATICFYSCQDNGVRLLDPCFLCWHACDKSLSSLNLLKTMTDGPTHVFDGMLEMLNAEDVAELKKMRPAADATPAEKLAAYAKQRDYMEQNQTRLFPKGMKAHNCVKHPGSACSN